MTVTGGGTDRWAWVVVTFPSGGGGDPRQEQVNRWVGGWWWVVNWRWMETPFFQFQIIPIPLVNSQAFQLVPGGVWCCLVMFPFPNSIIEPDDGGHSSSFVVCVMMT